jgi:hypothetical protein
MPGSKLEPPERDYSTENLLSIMTFGCISLRRRKNNNNRRSKGTLRTSMVCRQHEILRNEHKVGGNPLREVEKAEKSQ